MEKNKLKILDKEEKERIDYLMDKSSTNPIDILKFDKIKSAVTHDNLIIQGSSINPLNIVSSIPFYSYVFFEWCPKCMPDFNKFEPLLDTGYFIPILTSNYSNWPDALISKIIKYPHMTFREYLSFRFLMLQSSMEDIICPHCLKNDIDKDIELLYEKWQDKLLYKKISYIITTLSPISSNDEELITIFKSTLKESNYDKFSAFYKLSILIGRIKTAEAFHSPLSVSSKISVEDDFANYIPIDLNDIMRLSDDIIISGLEFDVPVNFNLPKYIDILLKNRDGIRKISKNLINQAQKKEENEKINLPYLMNEIANINEQVRNIQKSKKYKMFKIGTDLLSANTGLISLLSCATLLGFSGNLFGCGASISAGMVGKIFKSSKKYKTIMDSIKSKEPIQELKELIQDSLEAPFQRLLSFFFWKDLKIIQAMRIKEKFRKI